MKYLFALILISAIVSCNNADTKDEAYDATHQKIVVDAVAIDNDNITETESGVGMATLPK